MNKIQRSFSPYWQLKTSDKDLDSTIHKKRPYQNQKAQYNSVSKFQSFDSAPIRKKIFGSKVTYFNHIEIGINNDDLVFQDLDTCLFPICSLTFKCGCESQVKPCKRITKQISKEALNQMKKKYEQIKQFSNKKSLTSKTRKLSSFLPSKFPEALLPSLQSIIIHDNQQLLTPSSLSLLSYILFHTKIDYLAYWIYKQISQQFKSQYHSLYQSLLFCINMCSKTLTRLVSKKNIRLDQFVQKFCLGYGSTFIPIESFSLFIEFFNQKGRHYLSRVLFVLLLNLNFKICQNKSICTVIEEEKQNIPWQRVLIAASDKRLYS